MNQSFLMRRPFLTLLGVAGAAALFLGALGFQYIGELAPCKLCYWQRYGHVGAVMFGIGALIVPATLLLWLAAAGTASSAAVAVYHTGVERKWWDGPSSCSGGSIEGLSTDQLFEQIMSAPIVRCDEIPWEMFGLSMANYNIAASAALAVVFVLAARAKA